MGATAATSEDNLAQPVERYRGRHTTDIAE